MTIDTNEIRKAATLFESAKASEYTQAIQYFVNHATEIADELDALRALVAPAEWACAVLHELNQLENFFIEPHMPDHVANFPKLQRALAAIKETPND